jgi:hypothetical protein
MKKNKRGKRKKATTISTTDPNKIRDSHLEFIKDNWLTLATAAWREYQAGRRGAHYLFLEQGLLVKRKTSVIGTFLSEGSAMLDRLGGWPSEDAAKAIAEYDPQRQVAFWFRWGKRDFSFYVVPSEGAASPSQAYEIWRANRFMDNDQTHERVLKTRWLAIAAMAWEGFKSEGRGEVVIDVDNTDLSDPTRYFNIFYIARGQQPSRTLKSRFLLADYTEDFLTGFEESVNTYEPAQEVVVLFSATEGSNTHYDFASNPTPKEANQLQQSCGPIDPSSN